ncbi:unnamed protein product [Adineta steineri]|uniref:Uncharacterized protein n=1 Tax=Adineta steineri TaxID=433720 RepID=A0A819VLR8_9BILA|nr:unnamed protein product [Adineta steineri]CAF4110877.1 unnamed protein product [Adineta steineri]
MGFWENLGNGLGLIFSSSDSGCEKSLDSSTIMFTTTTSSTSLKTSLSYKHPDKSSTHGNIDADDDHLGSMADRNINFNLFIMPSTYNTRSVTNKAAHVGSASITTAIESHDRTQQQSLNVDMTSTVLTHQRMASDNNQGAAAAAAAAATTMPPLPLAQQQTSIVCRLRSRSTPRTSEQQVLPSTQLIIQRSMSNIDGQTYGRRVEEDFKPQIHLILPKLFK